MALSMLRRQETKRWRDAWAGQKKSWAKYDCARPQWGQRPLVAYTDPTTSSTGRSLLLGLYSIAAEKPPEDLTLEDVNNPKVVGYIKEFQGMVDHYLIGTKVLNTKIHQSEFVRWDP